MSRMPVKTAVTRKQFLCQALAIAVFAGLIQASATAQQAHDSLKAGFENPPQAARPRVWWHWMNGNIALDGAELDLAWMQRVGIGGVHTFSGALLEPSVVKPTVPFMSDAWKQIFRTTTEDARKAGMEVTIAGSPGWSETGGIWVTPEDAMKKYVWSETKVEGGAAFRGKLETPPSQTGPFQSLRAKRVGSPIDLTHDVYVDSAVVAFPTPAAELAPIPKYTASSAKLELAQLTSTGVEPSVHLTEDQAGMGLWVQADYGVATNVAAVTVGLATRVDLRIQASDDGISFRPVRDIPADTVEIPAPEQTFSFPVVHARFMRVLFLPVMPAPSIFGPSKTPPRKPTDARITRVIFHSGARVNRFEAKAGFAPSIDFTSSATPPASPDSLIQSSEVIDLTARLHPDGTLDWTPPAGHWTVLRFGYSLTGQTNGPAEPAATGLEVDKLDAGLVRKYMEHYLGLYDDATRGKLGDAGVQNLLTDSWEAGVQNWTPAMRQQLRSRLNYDPTPYLPALAGWVVNDSETSDRFLWDFRQTLKQMLADNHNGTLATVMHEHHMGYYTEAQGDTPRAIGDGMTMKSRSDIPTGEYWYRPFATDPGQPPLKADLEESASVAHVYGKQFAASESLTVAAFTDPWAFSPAMLKPVADEIFAHGINRILMHESHHQPFVDKKPGLELGFFGQYFNRNDTWAEQARPWVDYLSRTSYMLQQGQYVADVAYFYGEEQNLTEIFQHRFNTDVPSGYHYDYINPEALMTRLSVRNGRIVTPSGMSYRVLYLPAQANRFTLPVLQQIRDLVAAGAVLVAHRPVGGLGLAASDQKVEAIADEVWGTAGDPAIARAFGKGRVYPSDDLALALRTEGVTPDIAISLPASDTNIMTLHRKTANAEIYFFSNQRDRSEDVTVTCRVRGMEPELWHAEDGNSQPLSFKAGAAGETIPLHLEPYESGFIVFHKATLRSRTVPKESNSVLLSMSGPWQVSFEPGRGAPAAATFSELTPWDKSSEPGIKYFSGHATYTRAVDAPASWFRKGHRLRLDLGEVRELAEVSINGGPGIILWHAPYSLDVTDKLKPGKNTVTITVTNLWPNRLIGDKQPDAIKYTFAPQSPYKEDSPLLRSGLLGPVQVIDRSH